MLHVLCHSAGLIADDIRRRQRRIADFSERWYSEESNRRQYDELENLRWTGSVVTQQGTDSGKRTDRPGGKEQQRKDALLT